MKRALVHAVMHFQCVSTFGVRAPSDPDVPPGRCAPGASRHACILEIRANQQAVGRRVLPSPYQREISYPAPAVHVSLPHRRITVCMCIVAGPLLDPARLETAVDGSTVHQGREGVGWEGPCHSICRGSTQSAFSGAAMATIDRQAPLDAALPLPSEQQLSPKYA